MTHASTLTEKILARASGRDRVVPGDEIWAVADRMIMNDSSGPRRLGRLVEELGGVLDPEKVVIVSDHFVPAATLRHAEILKETRRFAGAHGISNFFEYRGILHNLVIAHGLVSPGKLLVGADSHTVTAGALGAVAVAVGSTELATIVASGEIWLRVPETIRVDLDGALPGLCDVRDVTMRLLGDLGTEHAIYRAIEWGGRWINEASIEDRLVLANQGIEMGAKNAIVEPTGILPQAMRDAGLPVVEHEFLVADPDARYSERHRYDVSTLEPLVAANPSPDNVVAARALEPTTVDMAWIGSCAGGRLADLHAAAEILRGKKSRVTMLVTPATQDIYLAAASDGTLATLAAAGATILPPGCGACAGVHNGVQGPGDRVIATATRNFPGRMGSREAEVYIGSPYTVAASAVAGRIIDPREVAEHGARRDA